MYSTFSPLLRTELIANGEQAGTWGTTTNLNLGTLMEAAIAGTATIALPGGAGDYALLTYNGLADEARAQVLKITATLTANRNVICPSVSKTYLVYNATSGAYTVTLKTAAGTGVLIPQGAYVAVYCDGTNVVDVGIAVNTHAASSKTTPVDADELPLADSATSFSLKKLTWANLKAAFINTANLWTAAQSFPSGTVTAPGITLNNEAGTGLYRIGANNDGYAVSGAKVLDISSTGLGVTGNLINSSGTTGLQSIPNWTTNWTGIGASNLTPSATNYSIIIKNDGSVIQTNAVTGGSVTACINNTIITSATSTGLAVTGTLSATTGAAVGGATAGAGGIAFPATQVAVVDPNTLDDYAEYTAASTACTGALTNAVVWKAVKVGKMVTLVLPNILGTTTDVSTIVMGVLLPASFRPSVSLFILCSQTQINNVVSTTPGMVVIAPSGAISVYRDAAAIGWGTAANTGFYDVSVSWMV